MKSCLIFLYSLFYLQNVYFSTSHYNHGNQYSNMYIESVTLSWHNRMMEN